MSKKILEDIDEWLTLINKYKFLAKIDEISEKIARLKTALNKGKADEIEAVTKAIYNNTDFENIEIKWRYRPGQNRFITVQKNAIYFIDRLTLLGFKKIIENEFEQIVEQFNVETRIVYKELKLALEKKRSI